jgi:hypothetical protein
MASEALVTQGTTIMIGTSTVPATPSVLINDAVGWSGPRFDRTEIDVTNLGSLSKEFRLGLQDPGEFTVDVNFNPWTDLGQKECWDMLGQTIPRKLRLAFAGTPVKSFDFDVLVKGFESTGAPDDKADGTITFRITGPVVKSPGV